MFNISDDLKERISELNKVLRKNYQPINEIGKKGIRDFIEGHIGTIDQISRLSKEELKDYHKKGGIVGVDASKNKIGGAYPHYVELFQGLAKSTLIKDKPIFKADFYTPLYMENEGEIIEKMQKENPSREEIDAFIKNYKLSSIEVEVAVEAAKELKPHVIMMDGSLIRYRIECLDKWEELRKVCEERKIILIGVIKDIKTSIIGNELIEKGRLPETMYYLYDRELLYGNLEYGEMIKINANKTGKYEKGLSSCFIRTSQEPTVVGMDILKSQESYIGEMAKLVYTLTPEKSRGVPMWLDIIDTEVKLSDKMIHGLLERYLDRELLEKLFVSERSKRTL